MRRPSPPLGPRCHTPAADEPSLRGDDEIFEGIQQPAGPRKKTIPKLLFELIFFIYCQNNYIANSFTFTSALDLLIKELFFCKHLGVFGIIPSLPEP